MASERYSSAFHANLPRSSPPGAAYTSGIDSHADMCCLGHNCVPLYYADEVVDVTSFTDRYTALRDVPVAGGATHIQFGDGSKYILVVNQGHWFGEELEVFLLNPYQLRPGNALDSKHPLPICDF